MKIIQDIIENDMDGGTDTSVETNQQNKSQSLIKRALGQDWGIAQGWSLIMGFVDPMAT